MSNYSEEFVFLRTKMGVEIRCTRLNGVMLLRHGCKLMHAVAGEFETESDADAAFFTAWQSVTGYQPFTIVRRVSGKYRKMVTSFIPADCHVDRIIGNWHRYTVKYSHN